jgi:succinate-semialdehyde dehydrogenase/glutarate-semialdehyde dehydrogenase
MTRISTINPVNGEKLKEYSLHNDQQVTELLSKGSQCFSKWKKTPFRERSNLMYKAAEVLEKNKNTYALTMTQEMGKTFSGACAEVDKCAWVCRYYADHAEQFLSEELVDTDASKSMVSYQPLGIVLAVMPWNYPFWQVFRFAAPALMSGNIGILKHASNVPGCALHIEEVFREAGFPEYCFTALLIKSDQVEHVIKNGAVKAVTLTGSGPAGSSVASIAGKHIKKSVLELGGSDPYIILEDADLEHAADQCMKSRLLNTGQSCIGAKRFLVVEEVYNQFHDLFLEKMKSATMGDPMTNVDIGPMARIDLRDEVHTQVVESVKKGAELVLGGYIPEGQGAFYPPTVLTEVKRGMPAYDEEIFGPVASVIKVKDEAEAIAVANDTGFGLGACVFTGDLQRGERIAKVELEAGCCFVNQFVKSDPRLPFGGIKGSGYGRELSHYGIKEFVNIKTIWIQ